MEKRELTYIDYLKVTIPFILSTAVQPLLGAFNTALMGNMPETAYVAAVSFGVIFLNNVYWLFGFLRVATTTFSAQALGKESQDDTASAFLRPLFLALLLGLLFVGLYPILLKYYAGFMNIQGQELQFLEEYLDTVIISAPMVLVNYVIIGWLMGQMMIRSTMVVQISMNVLNMILAGVFTLYLGWGISGLALSVVLAQLWGVMLGLGAVIKSQRLELHPKHLKRLSEFGSFGPLLKMQADLMIRTVCLLSINNLFARSGNAMGMDYMAANAILLELIFVISFIFDGMANGLSVFAGRSYGSHDVPMLKSSIKTALKTMMVFGLCCSLLVLNCRSSLVAIMTDQEALVAIAGEYSIYLAIHALTAGLGLVLYGVYTAAGYTRYIRNMMIMAAVLFFLLLQIFLPKIGNHALWLSYILTYLFESLAYAYGLKMLFRRFYRHIEDEKNRQLAA